MKLSHRKKLYDNTSPSPGRAPSIINLQKVKMSLQYNVKDNPTICAMHSLPLIRIKRSRIAVETYDAKSKKWVPYDNVPKEKDIVEYLCPVCNPALLSGF